MRHTLFFLFLALQMDALAQPMVGYTYVTDRRFNDPTDLLGWQFRPEEIEIPKVSKRRVSAGDYRFGVTQNNLFVEGADIAGVYSINNINPTEYGYVLNLMNARNPTLQGHLKVILNPQRQADAVIFKRSPKETEMVFWLPVLSEKDYKAEEAWFTDRRDLILALPDSLWGQTLRPFLLIDKASGKQQRLTVDDSTYLHFSREITRSMKDGKKRKKGEVTLVDSLKLTIDDLLADTALLAASGYVIEERMADFARFKTRLTYEDGGTEWVEKTFEIKGIDTRADRKAPDGAEKYLWEIKLKNGEVLNLYLDTRRYVSSLGWGASHYIVRGY